jgi:hypothetical protein
LKHESTGVFGKGFGSKDAVVKAPRTDLRRPLTNTPVPKLDNRRVYIAFSFSPDKLNNLNSGLKRLAPQGIS